jgi:CRP-like cAMP-binding protein
MSCVFHSDNACIRRVPIFENLTETDVKLLSTAIHSQTYAKGEYVFHTGEQSDTLYVIHKGVVKITKVAESGKEHILRFLFPGDFDGQFALFNEEYHYADAEVMEETVVCKIRRDDLQNIMMKNPEIAYRLVVVMSERLKEADEWIGAISLLDVEKRLAKVLLIYGSKHEPNESFELPVSKKDFASLIGVVPETLSRKLSLFENQGLIELKGRKSIRILNMPQLKQIAEPSA